MAETEADYMTPKQVASKLQVSEQTVRNMFHEGKLKGIRFGVKLIRIRADAVVTEPEPVPKKGRRKVRDWIGGGK